MQDLDYLSVLHFDKLASVLCTKCTRFHKPSPKQVMPKMSLRVIKGLWDVKVYKEKALFCVIVSAKVDRSLIL